MKKRILILFPCAMLLMTCSFAQSIGIGTTTPNVSSILDIRSTSKGLLIPRMTTSEVTSISNPAKGLMVYDSIKNQLMVNMGSTVAPNWQTIVFKSGWSLNGNSGTNSATDFIGNIDSVPFNIRANNQKAGRIDVSLSANSFFGYQAGNINNSSGNTGVGYQALYSNTDGAANVAIGSFALNHNTTGGANTACGYSTLVLNTTGQFNSAYGAYSLASNNGSYNTTNGYAALFSNMTGNDNTAIGSNALFANNLGSNNTATGANALKNSNGTTNTANGSFALYNNQGGNNNTGIGGSALYNNISGVFNTATGYAAMIQNNNGHYNAAFGSFSLRNTISAQYNTALGYSAGDTYNNGYNNVFVGANVDVNTNDLFNVIAMGQGTIVTSGSSTARFGNSATVSYGGWAGWSNVSDGRFKKDVMENVPGIDFINKLRPVTYYLAASELDAFLHKNDTSKINSNAKQLHAIALNDKEKIRYSGFVAQEVEAAAKELGFDFSGVDAAKNENDTYGLRYAEFVVPLVKAVQELSKQNNELKKQNEELLKRIERLESTLVRN